MRLRAFARLVLFGTGGSGIFPRIDLKH